MALSGVAPAEKAENLIYSVLPVSIGLWLGASMTTNLAASVAIVGVVAPLLTILLYELRVDEFLVKAWYRSISTETKKQFEKSFLAWMLFFKPWSSPATNPPGMDHGADDLTTEVDHFVQSTVSSSAVSQRLWPIRGSFYLFLSIPFLTWTALSTWDIATSSIPAQSILFLGIAVPGRTLANMVFMTSVFWCVQYGVNHYHHRRLRSHIRELILFRFVQRLLSIDTLENPSSYIDSPQSGDRERISLQKELVQLETSLNLNDWITFVDRWYSLREVPMLNAQHRFSDELEKDLLSRWGQHISDIYSNRRYSRVAATQNERCLGWIIYCAIEFAKRGGSKINTVPRRLASFAYRMYLFDTQYASGLKSRSRSMMERTLQRVFHNPRKGCLEPVRGGLLIGLANPLYVFATAPLKVLEDSRKQEDISHEKFVWKLNDWFWKALESRVSDQLRPQLEDEVRQTWDPDLGELIPLLLKMIRACYENGKDSGLWRLPERYYGANCELLDELYERVRQWVKDEDWAFILAQFLKEAPTSVRVSVLKAQRWNEYMNLEPVLSLLKSILADSPASDQSLVDAVNELDIWKAG